MYNIAPFVYSTAGGFGNLKESRRKHLKSNINGFHSIWKPRENLTFLWMKQTILISMKFSFKYLKLSAGLWLISLRDASMPLSLTQSSRWVNSASSKRWQEISNKELRLFSSHLTDGLADVCWIEHFMKCNRRLISLYIWQWTPPRFWRMNGTGSACFGWWNMIKLIINPTSYSRCSAVRRFRYEALIHYLKCLYWY